jgi:hypothetical protein
MIRCSGSTMTPATSGHALRAAMQPKSSVVERRDQHLVAHAFGDAGAVGHGLGKFTSARRREAHLRLADMP